MHVRCHGSNLMREGYNRDLPGTKQKKTALRARGRGESAACAGLVLTLAAGGRVGSLCRTGADACCCCAGVICAYELNVEEKLVLMCAGGNKAKALCHGGAITCSTFDTETQTPITGSYDMTVREMMMRDDDDAARSDH